MIEEVLTLLASFDNIYLGLSGGLDSMVLLHILASDSKFHHKIKAIHINHGISTNAHLWQTHCERWCYQLNIPLHTHLLKLNKTANLENLARNERYNHFIPYISDPKTALVLAHHQDDQAETVLLNLCRGTGIDGLAAMLPLMDFAKGSIVRPFLSISRAELENYANHHKLDWVNDESNENCSYSRNFLRHRVLPLLEERWPAIKTTLARTARHNQQAQALINDIAFSDYPGLGDVSNTLDLRQLTSLPQNRLITILRLWFKLNGLQSPSACLLDKIINEVIFSSIDSNAEVIVGDNRIKRYDNLLYLLPKKVPRDLLLPCEWISFPAPLCLPHGRLIAKPSKEGLIIPKRGKIEIKFREGGEVIYWHGQTKSLKKLWQSWRVPPWLRDTVPLIFINNELAMVFGYAISDHFYNESSDSAWLVEWQPSKLERADF